MLFLGRAVVNDIFLSVRQIPERNIGAHAHFPADVYHDGPHERIPRCNGAALNGEGVIGNKRGAVHCAYSSCPVTGVACSLTVKCQFLCGWSIETGTAFRADQFLSGSDGQ